MREGNSENEFLYCGEQYNALTGFYYLRARYMNPTTGTFISEDAYAGRMHEPVTLHKYLYAHANPVKYTDPSGYMSASFGETAGAVGIMAALLKDSVDLGIGIAIIIMSGVVYDLYSSPAARFADFYQSDAQTNPEGAADDARSGDNIDGGLSDDALVVRGGTNKKEQFENGSGVTVDEKGNLEGVSVQSKNGLTKEELSKNVPHNKVGVTTVGDVRANGGNVIPSPTRENPNHATLSGITSEIAETLFNPVIPNPAKNR